MTDDKRELAEWVARWAGYLPHDHPHNRSAGVMTKDGWDKPLKEMLTSESLAWRAEDEHIALKGDPETSAYMVKRIMEMMECDRKEAIFRALRAAKGDG